MTETTNIRITCTMQLHENKRNSPNNLLETTIMTAVDDSLCSFGDSFKQVIYFQLENTFHIKKQEIPQRIDEFAAALEEIFGIGATLIEMKILKTLHDQVPGFVHFPRSDDLVFTDYVKNLRHFF
jgi:hypothetical protein